MPLWSRKKTTHDKGFKETLVQLETTREGCDAIKGTFDERTGLCEVKQKEDPTNPDQIIVEKFDEVKRPERMTGVETIESNE